jgi:hypothetical protein
VSRGGKVGLGGAYNTIRRRAARRLIVFHPEQIMESEKKMANLLDFAHHNV